MPQIKGVVYGYVVLLKKHTKKDSDKLIVDTPIMCDKDGQPLVIRDDKGWYIQLYSKNEKRIEPFYSGSHYITTGEIIKQDILNKVVPIKVQA